MINEDNAHLTVETYDLPSKSCKDESVLLNFISDLISDYERHSKGVSFLVFNPSLHYQLANKNLRLVQNDYSFGTIFGIHYVNTYNHPHDKITFCKVEETWKPFLMCEKCMKNNNLSSIIHGVLICKRPYLNTYKTSVTIAPSYVPDYCPYILENVIEGQ